MMLVADFFFFVSRKLSGTSDDSNKKIVTPNNELFTMLKCVLKGGKFAC